MVDLNVKEDKLGSVPALGVGVGVVTPSLSPNPNPSPNSSPSPSPKPSPHPNPRPNPTQEVCPPCDPEVEDGVDWGAPEEVRGGDRASVRVRVGSGVGIGIGGRRRLGGAGGGTWGRYA